MLSSFASARRPRGSSWPASRGGSRLEIEVTLRAGRREEGSPERRDPARSRAAPLRGLDARVHARPAGRRQGRPGRPAGVLRPCSGAAVSGPCGAAGGVRRGRGANGTPRSGGSRSAPRRETPSRRGPSESPISARRSSMLAGRRSTLLAPPFAERAGELGLPGGDAALRGRAADGRSARGAPRRRPRPRHDGPRAAPGRRRDSRRRPRPAPLRLAGRAAPRRALADPRRGRAPGRTGPRAAAAPARRRPLRARRGQAAQRSPSGSAGPGQTLITATAASALPAEPAQLVEVTPGAAR